MLRKAILLVILILPLVGAVASTPPEGFDADLLSVLDPETPQPLQEPDFSIALDPDEMEVIPGEKAVFNIVISAYGGFSATLKFDVSGVPPYSFYEIKASQTALQLRIYTTENTPPGVYTVKLKASGGGKTHTASAKLTVTGQAGSSGPGFRVKLRPSSVSIMPGETAEFTVVIIPIGGFSETVHYKVSGIPPKSLYQLSTSPSGTEIILKVITTEATPEGVYNITMTVTGGGKTRKAYAKLVVGNVTTQQQMEEKGLSISVLPATLRVKPGANGTITVRVYKKGDFSAPATIRVKGLPDGVQAWADVNNTVPNYISVVRVIVPADAQPGTYYLTVTISGGGVVEERKVSLVVEGTTTQQQGTVPQTTTSSQVVVTGTASPPTGDFTLEVVPSSISLQRGGSGSVAITVRSVGGFAGEVELSATGLPPGTSYYFSPSNRVAAGGTASLVIKVEGSPGTYPVKIEGRCGDLVRSASFTLKIEGGESRCIIATAAFGSELHPQVERLRAFRDGVVMSTYAGSRFMAVFNAFYYSWSPAVAEVIRGSEPLAALTRALVSPLLSYLALASSINDVLASVSSELSIVVSGLVVSFLLGLTYLTPPILLVRGFRPARLLRPLTVVLVASVTGIAVAELMGADLLMQLSTSCAVLSAIALPPSLTSSLMRQWKWVSRPGRP